MLQSKNLKFAYSNKVSFQFPDIECQAEKTCLLIGRSGVGKTTLLHLLGGLIKPSEGEIYIGESDLSKMSSSSIDLFRGRHIGIIFQKPHFISSISILQNLAYAQTLAGKPQDLQAVRDLLHKLDIEDRASSKPNQLSQGELQRASVARAVLNQPSVILADEPTSALDDESCAQVVDLLSATARDLKAALVIVTHDSRLKDIIPHQIVLS